MYAKGGRVVLELFSDAEIPTWIGAGVLALGGIGTLIVTLLKNRSQVKLDEFRELNQHLQVALDKESKKREELEARHDREMESIRKDLADCERTKVWQEARIESMEFALEQAKIPYRKPKPPWAGPDSDVHKPPQGEVGK